MSAVTVERLPGHVALVTIDRPEARNAVNGDVATGLEAAVDATEADDDIRAVVLTGAGREAFCAGADLKEVSAGRGSALRTERGGFAGFVYRERSKPWIAAVNGKALAGGTELVLACDLVVAVRQAAFGLPEVLRGLIAAAGGLYRLPRAIPPNIALELILTAGQLDAERAHGFGLVNRLVDDVEGLREAALALAAEIARNGPVAVRQSLRVAREANSGLDEAALRALTRDAFERVAASEDFKEGPRAFIEKRAPRWSGR
ncbi:enoyl-CoA hydratase [Variovorax boronicumulans]|uniref:Enoyl-CoA hydratase n=1 Tax=Variovorax boronicumulans TaxID=436515 RepID=A0AAW8E316_9BURK|nr:enoyl-CoA hydratase-related protein [Variovorax boronicumulans]MDP9880947.1 enoyl-CoA hydratase [Variovorax boronicumulans]MDP9926278.1 enoyl-CoA hydratase [Variovorax boronicumulans]